MDEDWHNKYSKHVDRCKHILENELLCDCTFLIEGQQVSGHKLVLSMASPVFHAMFYGNLPEDSSAPIVIPDIKNDVFSQMLRYIYHDEVNISSYSNACDLYNAAQKYMLKHLKSECIDFLKRNLNVNNVVPIFEFAMFQNEEGLEKKCLKEIQISTREVLNSPNFIDASEVTLEAILDIQKLNIESEAEIVKAVNKWAVAESKREGKSTREAVNKFVDKIRLLTLSKTEFIKYVSNSNIFTEKEKLEVLLKIVDPNLPPMENGLCQTLLKRRPWKPKIVADLVSTDIVNSRCDGSDWLISTFISNTPLALIGIKIRLAKGPPGGTYNEHVAVKLGIVSTDELIAEGKICEEVAYNSTKEIVFDSPATIAPFKEHAINIFLFKQGTYPIGRPTTTHIGEEIFDIEFLSHTSWERAHPYNSTVLSAILYAEPLD